MNLSLKAESIVFISEHGNSLPIALSLATEGAPFSVYVHEPDYKPCYKNILPRLSLDGLERALKDATHVVIDMVRPNKKKPEDIEFLKRFGLPPDSFSIFGPLGDKLRRRGVEVTGGSRLTDRWELNREEGFAQARRIGLKIPEYHKFTSFKEGAAFVSKGEGRLNRLASESQAGDGETQSRIA